MSEHDAKFADSVIHEWTYKPGPMRDMVIQVLTLALRRAEFSANDLPLHGQAAQGGVGIAGSVIRHLIKDGILAPVGTFDGPHFCPRVAFNAGGNKIGVYRLDNAGLARTLLNRHHPQPDVKTEQMSLL
jgi:hypothetical protein